MKPQQFLVGGTTLVFVLALAVGLSQAQSPRPEQVSMPLASVGSAFTYQGQLKNVSGPITGNCDFEFSLWDAATGGTSLAGDYTHTNVAVSNGLFTAQIEFGPAKFTGDARWLQIAVRCPAGSGSYTTLTPRQEITPAPYALSLKPGAHIQGNTTSATLGSSNAGVYGEESSAGGAGIYGLASYTGNVCALPPSLAQCGGYFESKSAVCGYGVYGKGSVGVYGQSDASSGYGGVFKNTAGGVDVSAIGSGIIKSTADTQIVVSPFDLSSWSNVSVITSDQGYAYLRTSASGSQQVHLPVTLPAQVFGVPQKLKSIKVCYQLDNASSYIYKTEAYYINDSGVRTFFLEDDTDRTSTFWTCYTSTDSTPDPIQGSVVVRLWLYYTGTGWSHDIVIGSITLTLTEK